MSSDFTIVILRNRAKDKEEAEGRSWNDAIRAFKDETRFGDEGQSFHM